MQRIAIKNRNITSLMLFKLITDARKFKKGCEEKKLLVQLKIWKKSNCHENTNVQKELKNHINEINYFSRSNCETFLKTAS